LTEDQQKQIAYSQAHNNVGPYTLTPEQIRTMMANAQAKVKAAAPPPLPNQQDFDSGMSNLAGLVTQLAGQQTPDFLLKGSMNAAAQETARRGLDGPLAATIGTEAANQSNINYQTQKNAQLLQALGLQTGTSLQSQAAETQRRMFIQALQQAYEQAKANGDSAKASGLGQLLGMLIGGIGGFAIGGPVGAAAGAGIGGGIGSGIGGAFASPSYAVPPTSPF